MKRLLNIVLLVCAPLWSLLAQNPSQLMKQANELYTSGNFKEAAQRYEAIIGQGYTSAEVYYNLGNAYFKMKDIPAAILNYERANLLSPKDEDIQFNLDLARTYVVDKIEPLPEFMLVIAAKNFRSWFSSNTWAYIAFFAFLLVMVAVAFYIFTNRYSIKRLTFAGSILLTIVFVISLTCSISLRNQSIQRNHAILFAPVVSVKSSPASTGSDIFILHAGTKVMVTRSLGEWSEIKIADGSKGWVLSSTFERI